MIRKIDNILVIVGIALIILAVSYVFLGKFIFPQSSSTNNITPEPTKVVAGADFESNINDTASLEKAIQNSEVGIPGTNLKVNLTNGVATMSAGEPVYVNFISLVGKNRTKDGSYDVFGSYGVNYGGSGTFVSVALFHVTPNSLTYTSSTPPLGDRIPVNSATASAQNVNDYTLTVSYMDRTASQSMADKPTVPESSEFEVRDHVILK